MSLRQYLIVMTAGTFIAYVLLANVIYLFDPTEGFLPAILMYAAIALASIGTFSILGFLLRHYFSPKEIVFREVLVSFRQSIWLAILVCSSLAMKHAGLFSLISVTFLIVALAALELFIVSRNRN